MFNTTVLKSGFGNTVKCFKREERKIACKEKREFSKVSEYCKLDLTVRAKVLNSPVNSLKIVIV